MTELLNYLRAAIDDIGELTITEEHIAILDDMREQMKHTQGKRSDFKFAMDVDCVLLEEVLIRTGKVEGTLAEHRSDSGSCVYDCRVNLLSGTAFVDFKCLDKELNFNVSSKKYEKKKHDNRSIIEWVQDGIVKGLLTDYCFYRMHRPEPRPLRVGDTVRFELINVLNSRFVIKSLNPSTRDPGGKFYKVEKYDQ